MSEQVKAKEMSAAERLARQLAYGFAENLEKRDCSPLNSLERVAVSLFIDWLLTNYKVMPNE